MMNNPGQTPTLTLQYMQFRLLGSCRGTYAVWEWDLQVRLSCRKAREKLAKPLCELNASFLKRTQVYCVLLVFTDDAFMSASARKETIFILVLVQVCLRLCSRC